MVVVNFTSRNLGFSYKSLCFTRKHPILLQQFLFFLLLEGQEITLNKYSKSERKHLYEGSTWISPSQLKINNSSSENKKITTVKEVLIPGLNLNFNCYFSVYSLAFVSIEQKYQTRGTVFHRLSKHRQKYPVLRLIFSTLFGIWIT